MEQEIWSDGQSYNFIRYDICLMSKADDKQSGKSNLLGGLNSLRHLTVEEYDLICEANNRLLKYANDSNLYRSALWNHRDLHGAIKRHLFAYANQDSTFKEEYPENLDIERQLLNFLNSVSMFLDNTASRLTRDYGKESDLLKIFDILRSSTFEKSPSYRFMYGLRNHMQHRSKVLNFQITGRIRELDGNTEYAMRITVDRDQILRDPKSTKHTREAVSKMPAQIDLLPHVDRYMKHITEISLAVAIGEFSLLGDSAKVVIDYTSELGNDTDLAISKSLMDLETLESGKKHRWNMVLQNSTLQVPLAKAIVANRFEDVFK